MPRDLHASSRLFVLVPSPAAIDGVLRRPNRTAGQVSFMPPLAHDGCYVYWTNKGGVGKTTLCFHSAVMYAEAHPTTNVVAIDMDEQANLSQTMLTSIGNAASGEEYVSGAVNCAALRDSQVKGDCDYSRTICGMLLAQDDKCLNSCAYKADSVNLEKEACFLVNPSSEGYNPNLPKNLWLLCGDPRLLTLVPRFQAKLSVPGAQDPPGAGAGDSEWAKINKALKMFLSKVCMQLPEAGITETVAFIDTNPSLSIWTQMALVAGDKLVVPVNADDYSTAAIYNMFFTVYGLYGYGGNMERFEKTMFAAVAKTQKVSMPRIHAIIHNRSTIYAERQRGAFAAMSTDQARALFDAYQEAEKQKIVDSVFAAKPGASKPNTVEEFAHQYTGVMRDMQGSGVATAHGGIPMWMVKRHKKNIKNSLHGQAGAITTSATSSMTDFIGSEKGERARSGGLLGLIGGRDVGEPTRKRMWEEFETSGTRAYGPQARPFGPGCATESRVI